jgi:hypothetical protein
MLYKHQLTPFPFSQAYDPIHPPGTIEEYLGKEHHKGKVKESDLKL